MNYLATLEHKAMERGMEKGMEKGMETGMEIGVVIGESRILKKQLERRFGPLPSFVTEKLGQAREEELECWGEAVLTAPTLDAVFQINTPH